MLRKFAAAMAIAAMGIAARAPDWSGIWRNPADSVHIKVERCGPGLCGTVVWANDKAKADVAAAGGTLIGAQLFRDFRAGEDGLWRGQVYVPDIDQTVSGTIASNDRDSITATGCLFAGFGCKTQVWTRVR